MPRPPASAVAATSREPATQPIPVCTIGYRTPTNRVRAVSVTALMVRLLRAALLDPHTVLRCSRCRRLHDSWFDSSALRSSSRTRSYDAHAVVAFTTHAGTSLSREFLDRKSTRLNSSHVSISYAVFCLKKKTY